MPELPDVEIIRRTIAGGALHKDVNGVHVHDEKMLQVSPSTLRRHLRGHALGDARRHGKWVVADIEGDDRALAMHFGMTGAVAVVPSGDVPRHARLVLDLADGSRLAVVSQRRLGEVTLVDDVDALRDDRRLGPDALDLSTKDLRTRLARKSGTIKGALMDQAAVAGIGNVYADEILYQARIHPEAKVPDLSDSDWRRLGHHMRRVLERAIGYHADRHEMPRTWLTPHRREEDPACPRCGTPLCTASVAGRPTYWCPRRV